MGSSSENILSLWEVSWRSQSASEECLESLGSEPGEGGGRSRELWPSAVDPFCLLSPSPGTALDTDAPFFQALRRPPTSAHVGCPQTILRIQLIRFSAFSNPFLGVCHRIHLVPLLLESAGENPKLGSSLYRLCGHFYMKLLHDVALLSQWLSRGFRALCFSRDTWVGWRAVENKGGSDVNGTPSL